MLQGLATWPPKHPRIFRRDGDGFYTPHDRLPGRPQDYTTEVNVSDDLYEVVVVKWSYIQNEAGGPIVRRVVG
uniref:Uncharacterized protein n=1 Tax=viral metagenome TaxID=1070528 RepID=A0A6M3LKL9_9ZZZZ